MTNKDWNDKPHTYKMPSRLDLGVLQPGDTVHTAHGVVKIEAARADGTYIVRLDKAISLKGHPSYSRKPTNVFVAKRVMTLQLIAPAKTGYHDD